MISIEDFGNIKELKSFLNKADLETIIDFINDNLIDTEAYPFSLITEVDNENWWDSISKVYGTLWVANMVVSSGIDSLDHKYMMYDGEEETLFLFDTKKELIQGYGGSLDFILDAARFYLD